MTLLPCATAKDLVVDAVPTQPADDGALVVRECEAPCYRSESGRPRGADDGQDEQGVRIGDGAGEHERRQSCETPCEPPVGPTQR